MDEQAGRRVLDAHGEEIRRHLRQLLGRDLSRYIKPVLEHRGNGIRVEWQIWGLSAMHADTICSLEGPTLLIEMLLRTYTCCAVEDCKEE